MKPVVAFVVLLAAPILTGAIGAVASANAPSFYGQLTKPAWAPPASVFGPVWTTLYLLMGIAAFLVWRARGGWSPPLTFFLLHLIPNALWSWLFFHWRLGAASLADIVVLSVAIVVLVVWFWRVQPFAGALLLPYLLWVTYASALNASLWRANLDRL